MNIHIFSFPFEPEISGFDTQVLETFCLDKEVFDIQAHFFLREGQPYWTIYVRYRVSGVRNNQPLTDRQNWNERDRLLMDRLRAWRKQKAGEEGIPAYIVFTNRQMEAFVRQKVIHKSAFGPIKGFGAQKIARYGADIIRIVKAFTDQPKNHAEGR